MNFEKGAGQRFLQKDLPTKELRDRARDEVFEKYWEKLGLSARDIVDAEILDVGAGPLAAFGDALQARAKESGFNCRVVSISKEQFVDVRADGVDYDKNFRISGLFFENLELKRKMELSEEPQFNTIVAMDSVPLIYARGSDVAWQKKWSGEQIETVSGEIKGAISSAVCHLKRGGRAIFYPIYKGTVLLNRDTGETRDFSEWRKILEDELAKAKEESGEAFNYFFQEVDRADKLNINDRLIIEKKK